VILASDAHSTYSQGTDQLIESWHKKLAEAGAVIKPCAEIEF